MLRFPGKPFGCMWMPMPGPDAANPGRHTVFYNLFLDIVFKRHYGDYWTEYVMSMAVLEPAVEGIRNSTRTTQSAQRPMGLVGRDDY